MDASLPHVGVYRDRALAQGLAARIRTTQSRPWTLMEICGGQTHAIVKYGIESLLGERLTLVHGPGCPVCVTPISLIDQAAAIAAQPEVTLCAFGDMLRVPGTRGDLLEFKSLGHDVRLVYSPLDALGVAHANPGREVVMFAIGFETTAPAYASAVQCAARDGVENFSLLSALVRVPPALEAILGAEDRVVDGVLAAGHVCAVMGTGEYHALAERFGVPIVITGFEPLDILAGIERCIERLERDEAGVFNAYPRTVADAGNVHARAAVEAVFETVDRAWRGFGVLPASGLGLREAFAAFDATRRFEFESASAADNSECISARILTGAARPDACPAFGSRCVPEHPLGAPMVSSEGACAAYYHYRQP